LNFKYMHSTEKAHDTTLDYEKYDMRCGDRSVMTSYVTCGIYTDVVIWMSCILFCQLTVWSW